MDSPHGKPGFFTNPQRCSASAGHVVQEVQPGEFLWSKKKPRKKAMDGDWSMVCLWIDADWCWLMLIDADVGK